MTRETQTSSKNGPVKVTKSDPKAWKAALKMADGNARRLRTNPDGTVTVRNKK